MSKYAYNHVKADETIAEQKKLITELRGQIIRLNLELQHARKTYWNEGKPTESGNYMCMFRTEENKLFPITQPYSSDWGWLGVPKGWEILGWMEIPKWEE